MSQLNEHEMQVVCHQFVRAVLAQRVAGHPVGQAACHIEHAVLQVLGIGLAGVLVEIQALVLNQTQP